MQDKRSYWKLRTISKHRHRVRLPGLTTDAIIYHIHSFDGKPRKAAFMSSEDKTIIADPGNLTVFNPPNRNRACLVQYSGSKLGKRYPLDESEMTIGRSPTAKIVISEASVSRQHAVFHQNAHSIEVEDMGSANGTFVNDQRAVGKVRLKDGDMLRLGTIVLKFFAHDNIDGIIQDKIYRMATIDAGTQIFNKQYLTETLAAEVKTSLNYQRPLSLIYFDLDHFKMVNDTFGHNAGDQILKDTAAIAKSAIRKEDVLGRFGGEEFVIILPNTTCKTAVELAERIRVAVEKQTFEFEIEQKGVKKRVRHTQTVSLGVAQFNPSTPSPKDILEAADRKLYESKRNGRNRVTA